jgi:hypothetical protein
MAHGISRQDSARRIEATGQAADQAVSNVDSNKKQWGGLTTGDLAAHGFAVEIAEVLEVIPVVAGGELINSRLVFTRLVLITAHARKIDANRHMIANRPV